jgi:HEAT repeat protein
VAVPAIVGLAKHPAPPDVAALVRYANHLNPSVRNAAITALAAYPDPVAQHAIVERLGDQVVVVRATAAAAAAKGKVRAAIDPMIVLLARGEEPAARALAAIADVDLAARIADQLGKVPDDALALCLGAILVRPDFGPDAARVEVVRAIGKIQDKSAITALTDYLASSPKTPARTSRTEAQMIVDARAGGGK